MMSSLLAQQYNDDQDMNIVAQELTLTDERCISNQWRSVKLGEIAKEFISGGTPSTKRTELWDGIVPWTTSATISEVAITLDTAQRFITEQGLQESASHLVPQGSLLVGTRVGVGKAVVNLLDIAISQDLTGIVLKTEVVQPDFIAYQFKTDRLQRIFQGYKRGTTIQGISRFDLQLLTLYLPPLSEQYAIAHVLQTVQQAIQARHKELELERERKAALMQHLFTNGTRNELTKQSGVGRIPESWGISRIQSVAEIAYGLTVNKTRSQSTQFAPYLAVMNVTRGALHLNEVKHIGMLNGDAERYRLQKGDVLLVEGNGNPLLLGSSAVWNDELSFVLHQNHLIRVRPNLNLVLSNWLMYYLNSDSGRAQLLGKAKTSSGLHSINSRIVANLQVPLPSLSEQATITEVIDICNSKIIVHEKEITLHEELFHTLLDELMTGRISTLPLVEQLEKGTSIHEQRT